MIENPGFYDITNDSYHNGAGKDWMSKSGFSCFLDDNSEDTPRKFIYEKSHPLLDIWDEKYEKWHTGTAVHMRFLEPLNYQKKVAIKPKWGGTGSKARKEEFEEKVEANDFTPITQAFADKIKGMNESLHSGDYETARKILEAPDKWIEQSCFWIDPETGIKCKTRPDLIASNMALWDVKKNANASWKAWNTTVFNLPDDLQAWMALEGVSIITQKKQPDLKRHDSFGHIVFQTEPPYDIGVHLCDDRTLESGKMKFRKALNVYAKCLEEDKWPGIPDEVQLISPPGWREIQMQMEEKKV